jgi:predicted enzyme related to lactoylglutathione lyase
MITKIGTAAVYVSDQPAAEEFWTKKIGFEVAAKKEMGGGLYWIEVAPPGGQSALVLYPRSIMEGWEQMKPSIVFECDDFDETYAQLKSRGVKSGEPMNLAWGKFLEFQDPDGNEFGIRG